MISPAVKTGRRSAGNCQSDDVSRAGMRNIRQNLFFAFIDLIASCARSGRSSWLCAPLGSDFAATRQQDESSWRIHFQTLGAGRTIPTRF
jgi:hypothetical protein